MEKYIERTKDEDNIKKRFKEYFFFFLQKRKAVSTFFLHFVGGVYNLFHLVIIGSLRRRLGFRTF